MDGKKVEARPLGGISEREPQSPTSATEIVNFTVHPKSNGWDNRIGYEKYRPGGSILYDPFSTMGRVDSLYIWSRHGGAQEWVIVEANGTLSYLQDFCTPVALRTIGSSRNVPAPNEPVTQYVPFGRFLCVLNGTDAPIKYSAWPVRETSPSVPVYPLGWEVPPSPPEPWGVDTSPDTHASAGKEVGIWAGGGGYNEYGLGSTTSSAKNGYRWKVSFVNNAGSESPLSNPSTTVEWQTPSAGTYANNRFIPYVEIPTGPTGTVARNIYRTKNLGDGGDAADEIYYYVTTITNNTEPNFYDHWSDNQLGSEAPGPADSIVFPALTARFGAVFKSCLFIDGGSALGNRLYWSLPGKPDQFTALDYYDVGTRIGGDITGLYSHYNFLIVMRENAIDIVRGNYGDFEVRPLSESIGTKAVNSVATIPDLGVVLLCYDGVYLLGGNVDGGGVVKFQRISDAVADTFKRMNVDVMARAVGVYSAKWREYHVYFAADGADRPNLGVVLHLDKMEWSVREDFPVSAITTNSVGDIVFGHHTGYSGTLRVPAGLFVVTRRRACGHEVEETTVGDQTTYKTVYADPCTSVYKSAWLDFGDPGEKKSVVYLYVYGYTMGDDPITVTVYKDHSPVGVNLPAIRLQRPDHADQAVYGKAKIDGKTVWEDNLISTFRISVDAGLERTKGQGGGALSHFAWEVKTTADFVLVGYGVVYTVKGQTIVTAKGV